MLAPSSPIPLVHGHQPVNGLDSQSPAHRFLDVPEPNNNRRRSASPSPAPEQDKNKKSKGKSHHSHFNMFRLHKHKKSKKKQKEYEEGAILSHSAGSVLLKEKNKHLVHQYDRRSFSGYSDRPESPAGLSTSSYPMTFDSEGDSEDEFIKTLTNPTAHTHSPSPLLRTPTPYQQLSSVESDWGQSSAGGGGGGGGDNVSIAASQTDGSIQVSVDTN